MHRRSFVDVLAKMLSERTGTKFTVLRVPMQIDGKMVWRYALNAERGEHMRFFFFGAQMGDRYHNINDMKRTLATLVDMIDMGFLPVVKS